MSTHQQWTDYREAVKRCAHGRWPEILAGLGIPAEAMTNRHKPCPGCGGEDRFRFNPRDDTGKWFCSQGERDNTTGGDGFGLLSHVHGWTFLEAVDAVAEVLGIKQPGRGVTAPPPRAIPASPPPATPVRDRNGIARRLNTAWSQSAPVDWSQPSPITRYLIGRGLSATLSDPPDRLRLHSDLGYWHPGDKGTIRLGTFPAMLATVTDEADDPVTLHRTYLTQAGEKAPVPCPRKLMPPVEDGQTTGAAIRLYPAAHRIALAEGIETALAVRASRRVNVWATVSAHGLRSVRLPDCVRSVEIWADHDTNGTGQRAADDLADRLLAEGRSVSVYLPPEPGDWLDALNASEVAA